MAALTAPDLLERSEQLTNLQEALETVAAEGRGRLVLVRGEAGIGKTTLLRRFCDEQPRSVHVVWGNCDPLFTPRPLGPLHGVPELEDVIGGDEEVMPHEVVAALADPAQLTAREVEVLALVAEGLRNADIARKLFVSEKTVGHHVSAILRKLDARTRGKAGAIAVRLGLVAAPR